LLALPEQLQRGFEGLPPTVRVDGDVTCQAQELANDRHLECSFRDQDKRLCTVPKVELKLFKR
jgi:hypothetical protein